MRAPETAATGRWGLALAGVSAVLWIVVSLGLMVHTVGQREVAIVYNFSGTITGKKDAGVVTTMPWQHIKKENIGIQHEEFDLDSTNAAGSKDQQPIYAKLFLNYRIEPSHVVNSTRTSARAGRRSCSTRGFCRTSRRSLGDVLDAADHCRAGEASGSTRRPGSRNDEYDINVVDVFVKNLQLLAVVHGRNRAQAEAGAGRPDGAGEGGAGDSRGEPEDRPGKG